MSDVTTSSKDNIKVKFTLDMPKSLKDRLIKAKRHVSVQRERDVSVGDLTCEGAEMLLKKFGF